MSQSLEVMLNQRLRTFAGLIALVGQKIYPLMASAKAATPYVVYRQVSKLTIRTLQRGKAMDRYRIQISCYAKEFVQAKTVARQVVLALETWDEVQAAFQDDETDVIDEERGIYIVDIDVFLWHR